MSKQKSIKQNICLKKTKNKGVGVFSTAFIKKGSLIEKAPVLSIPEGEIEENDELSNYVFTTDSGEDVLVLGFGSLYNHSYKPNVYNELDGEYMIYKALQDIEENEELTINYNGDPEDESPLWFEVES